MKIFKNHLIYIIIFTFLSVPVLLYAHQPQASNFDESGLFGSDEALEITIKTDLKFLMRNKKADEYQEGEITINNSTSRIRLKARENYQREACSFPPIMLNFSMTEFEDKTYEQLTKLKLANSCKMQKTYEQYILREYMIYKAFNLMTDKSFKVRLLKIDYMDSKDKIPAVTQYGFVLEDQYAMAKRLNGIIIKKEGIRDQSINNDHIILLSIFQFLIGNTDWQVSRSHKLKLLKLTDVVEAAPYVIPYDFDLTGMVNAEYAIPSPILGIATVRERLYYGKCYPENELKRAIEKFIDKKDAIYESYQNFNLFDKSSLDSSIEYLVSFYDIIEDEKKWKVQFLDKCRK